MKIPGAFNQTKPMNPQQDKITEEVVSLVYREVARLKAHRLNGEISIQTMEQWGCFLENLAKDIMITSMDGRGGNVYSEKLLLEKIRDLAAACVFCLEENL